MDRLYLQHDHTDLLDTLDDGVRGPRDGHCPLRGVGQHVPGHLDLGTCGLERPGVGRDPTERGSVHCSGTSWVPPGASRAQHALGHPPTLPQVTPPCPLHAPSGAPGAAPSSSARRCQGAADLGQGGRHWVRSGISGGRVVFKCVEFSLSVESEVTEGDGSQSQGLKRVAVFPGRSQARGLPSFGEGKASGFPWERNL